MSRVTSILKFGSGNFLPRACFIFFLVILWEIVSHFSLFGPRTHLIFPALEEIFLAFVDNFTVGHANSSLLLYAANSLKLLCLGFSIALVLSVALSTISIFSKAVLSIFSLMISVFDLLPGITLLPILIVAVGVNELSIILLVVHSVIWPLSRNLIDGFLAVPRIYIEVGQNLELPKHRQLIDIYIPASLSFLISGLRVGWARAWRGLLSAEMIFGIASSPGIGFFINQMRLNLKQPEMYATLVLIILIGLLVERFLFSALEKATIKKWNG